MASTFKPIGDNDVISTKTLLHEAIPITGTIVSGTYSDLNIKDHSHGMFQTVYDYPYLSSSSNHIFDITVGSSTKTAITITKQKAKKNNIYNQMAQLLVGYDVTGAIMQFDQDGDFTTTGDKINDAVFVSFSRLLVKDEIKKGSFSLTLGINKDWDNAHTKTTVITDHSASTQYKVNSPAGEYGILYATGNLNGTQGHEVYVKCGLIYYQAGVAVLSSSLFSTDSNLDTGIINKTMAGGDHQIEFYGPAAAHVPFTASLIQEEISGSANGLRNRITNFSFNNTTELNSTIYFCRVNHNEFNFSANPTYLSESQIRVKAHSGDMPVSYITTVGLYSADNQLLAVGKLSEPLRNDPQLEYILRARLDF